MPGKPFDSMNFFPGWGGPHTYTDEQISRSALRLQVIILFLVNKTKRTARIVVQSQSLVNLLTLSSENAFYILQRVLT